MQDQQPRVRPTTAELRSRRAISILINKSDPLNDMSVEDARQVLGLVRTLEAAEAADAAQAEKKVMLSNFLDGRKKVARDEAEAAAEFWGKVAEAETETTERAALNKKQDIENYNGLVAKHYEEPEDLFSDLLEAQIRLILDWRAELGRDERPALTLAIGADLAKNTSGGFGIT